jgi:ribonuclease VapC
VSAVVLDASALLALLQDEPGGDRVVDVLALSLISAVNFAEVVSHFIRNGMPDHVVDAMLRPLPVRVIDADVNLARSAGQLRAITANAGLSLGDRFCLALARRETLPAWTADKQWSLVAQKVGVNVVVIR